MMGTIMIFILCGVVINDDREDVFDVNEKDDSDR